MLFGLWCNIASIYSSNVQGLSGLVDFFILLGNWPWNTAKRWTYFRGTSSPTGLFLCRACTLRLTTPLCHSMGAIINALDTIDPCLCKTAIPAFWSSSVSIKVFWNLHPGKKVIYLKHCLPNLLPIVDSFKPWDLILVQHDLFQVRKIVSFCSLQMNLQFTGCAAVVVAMLDDSICSISHMYSFVLLFVAFQLIRSGHLKDVETWCKGFEWLHRIAHCPKLDYRNYNCNRLQKSFSKCYMFRCNSYPFRCCKAA